ncbi:hypothetical protein EVAR_73046_1 [Eumeta japonica]|uniref:Uncharacterized protein n=1 Tax=Eumeta variegata TaxID=151549 RepID=A0A4C1SSU9_EUMVA|nr:hypothetical protein EVAR_73046_1 [Eumeta japonica]
MGYMSQSFQSELNCYITLSPLMHSVVASFFLALESSSVTKKSHEELAPNVGKPGIYVGSECSQSTPILFSVMRCQATFLGIDSPMAYGRDLLMMDLVSPIDSLGYHT